MIFIKNVKLFTLNVDHKCHWSKLPKFISIMRDNYLIFPRRADLSRADLSGADLSGADLRGANLCGADLSRADLYRANLCGANLCEADLCGAELRGAELYRANLCGANLCEADLCGAELKGKTQKTPEKLTIVDMCMFDRFGSYDRYTIFYQTKEAGIVVKCGCFWGTIKAFKKQVKETHKDNKYAKCYLMMAKLAKLRLGE